MSADAGEYDVAIVGASTAGCTAARLFALRGARVALIERRPALDAYKTVCTHYIQSSATPTIEKLGLAPLLEERGAVHNSIDLWTRDSGWIDVGDVEAPYGYSITRRSLDPILRKLAADTAGVELIAGWTAVGLLGDGRPGGVEIEDRGHNRRRLNARLVVAADGRDTDAMAGLITDDIAWADPALPEPARGVPAVQEFMRASFRAFPDLRFGEPEPPALAVTGDVVLWAWFMEGSHRGPIDPPGFAPTGRTMRVEGVDQWTMRNGRIARYRAFYDMNDLARQLGISPAPGSRAERGMVAVQRLQARLARR